MKVNLIRVGGGLTMQVSETSSKALLHDVHLVCIVRSAPTNALKID